MTLHILGLSGSLRARSYNTALLHAARETLPKGVTLDTFALNPIPFYNADVEAEGMPEPVRALREAIAAADAVLIACPEYNYSVTGALKNALDWVSRGKDQPLKQKPVAIIGGGGRFGTVRAQQDLRRILLHTNAHVLNGPHLMVPMVWQHFDEELHLTNDDTRKQVQAVLDGLIDWAQRVERMHAAS